MLGAFVVLFAVAYVPVAMNPSLEVFGLPWYFVVFPVGMFLYNGLYLVLTYYLDFSEDVDATETVATGGE